MSEYTIYGFFNAQEIAGVLNAVVMLMGSTGVGGDYLSLIRVAAMLGLFVAISAAFLRHRGEDAVKYLIFMALFYSTMFVPRVNVVIEDRAAASGAPIPVNNVPLGLAFFASSTSHIGAWLAEQTETFFSLPDSSMRLAQSGVLGGARALRELGKAGINDPILAYDVSVFMQECINPELVSAPALLPMMFEARDIVNFIDTGSIVNPGRMAVLSGSGATDCSSAWTTLKAAINAESTNQLSQIARQFSPHLTQAQANTLFASLLPAQEAMIMTASSSAQASVRQRMMINALNESAGSMAVILNDPSASKDALGTAIAASSANSSYRIMAALARETLPIIRSAIELVVYGVFPIILVIIVVAGAGGGVVLRSYVMTMLWVQMWAPLYAIVNYVGAMAASRRMAASLGGVDGISITNAAGLQETIISSEAVVGILTIAVPIISMALIKGGEMAMTSMASGLTSPADRAAAAAGSQSGTGNLQLGNVAWGNYSANNANANKTSTGFDHSSPDLAKNATPYGDYNVVGAGAGQSPQARAFRITSGDVGASLGSTIAQMLQSQQSHGTEAALTQGQVANLNRGQGASFTRMDQAKVANAVNAALESSKGVDYGKDRVTGTTDLFSAGNERRAGQDGRTHEGFKFNSQAGVQGTVPLGASNPVRAADDEIIANAAREATGAKPLTGTDGKPIGKPMVGGESGKPITEDPKVQSHVKPARGLLRQIGVTPTASSGVAVESGVVLSNSQGTQYGSAEKAAIEERTANVVAATEKVLGKDATTGEKAALRQWAADFTSRVDSQYGTSTQSQLSEKYAKQDSITNSNNESFSTNDHSYLDQAFRNRYGSNIAAGIKDLAENGSSKLAVARDAMALKRADMGQNSTGLDGQPLATQIKAPEAAKKDNDAAVLQQDSTNKAAVQAADRQNQRQIGERQSAAIGGAPTGAVDNSAATLLANYEGGLTQAQARGQTAEYHQVAGAAVLLQEQRSSRAGALETFSAAMLGGAGTETVNQLAAKIAVAAKNNPEVQDLLYEASTNRNDPSKVRELSARLDSALERDRDFAQNLFAKIKQ